MNFATPGNISVPGIGGFSDGGFHLHLDGDDLFVPYEQFPWFRRALPSDIANVERPAPGHLHWPALDVDLALDSIRHPDRFPLVSRA